MKHKVVHMLIPAFRLWEGAPLKPATIWCSAQYVDAHPKMKTTEDKTKVTCRRCIALGGCGPTK